MKKFLAIILAILMFPSYLFSFLPSQADTEFALESNVSADGTAQIGGNSVEYTKTSQGGKTVFDFAQADCGWFNYFGIKYTSDAYMKGEITYTLTAGDYTEEFFLEPSETPADFRSFIDGYLDKKKSKYLTSLSFEPLNKSEAEFNLLGVSFFNREIPDREVYIQTEEYKLGVDLQWGGALSYLEDLNSSVEAVEKDGRIFVDSNASERYGAKAVNKNVNLINRFDPGRLIQQSYYGTPDYEQGIYNDTPWNYNPVQGGNQFGECSKIVDLICTENSLYVKCRPLDWAKPADCITPSYMEATYTISGGTVGVECRFVDFSGLPTWYTSQEIPAFYCVEPFNRFVYCKDGELAYENNLIFWPDAGYPMFKSSENWAAFTGEFDDSFGIGIYVADAQEFLAGVFSRETTTSRDPSVDPATSYIAAIEFLDFQSFSPIEYDYLIATGTAAEIRAKFN